MKGVILLGLLLLAESTASFSTFAQPAGGKEREIKARPVPGPSRVLPEGRAHAMKQSPSQPGRVYTGTPRGLFVSDDGGRSWALLAVDRTHEEVFTVAVHPTDPGVALVGRRDGLWQTRDGGSAWTPLAYPTLGPYVPLAAAISQSQPDVIYVATAREGVHKSMDGGYRWAAASKGLPEARAGGRPAEIRTLAIHPQNPDVAYVAHERHGVYRTTDGGASWHRFDNRLPVLISGSTYPPRLAFDPDDPRRLYIVFGQRIHSRLVKNQLYGTSDTGEWLPVEVDLPSNTNIVELTTDGATRSLRFVTEDNVWQVPLPRSP